VPDVKPLGMARDAHPSGAEELPEAAGERRRWRGSSSQRYLQSGKAGSRALLSLLPSGSRDGGDAPRSCGSQIKPHMGERSVLNHDLHLPRWRRVPLAACAKRGWAKAP